MSRALCHIPSHPRRARGQGRSRGCVLREGESLTQFIEEAVVAAAAWRRVQAEFVTRGEAAIERWKQEGGGHTVDAVMADLQVRLDVAKRQAAQRAGK